MIEAVYRGAEVRLGHPPSRRKTQCVAAETLKAAFGFPYMAIGFGSGTASRGARVFPFFIHGHAPHALTQHTHQRSPIRSSQFAVGQTRRAFRYLGLEKLVARCVRKKRWGSDVPHEVDAGGEDVAVEFLHAAVFGAGVVWGWSANGFGDEKRLAEEARARRREGSRVRVSGSDARCRQEPTAVLTHRKCGSWDPGHRGSTGFSGTACS